MNIDIQHGTTIHVTPLWVVWRERIKRPTTTVQGVPKTFPVRFEHKFGKLWTGAKRGDSTQVYRGCAAISQEISARGCAERVVSGCSLVWNVQRTERRVVRERAIQLWMVCPLFRTLPILATVAGQAGTANPKSQAPSSKVSSSTGNRECCAPAAFAGSPF
jgi:hypothetical protein